MGHDQGGSMLRAARFVFRLGRGVMAGSPEAGNEMKSSSFDSSGQTRSIEVQMVPRVRSVGMEAPWRWLEAGWSDLKSTPGISLAYGGIFAIAAIVMAIGLSRSGWLSLMLVLAGGFMLLGPLLAAGLYEVSRRRERGERTPFSEAIVSGATARGQLGFFGFILFLIFFIWIDVALLLFMLFFGSQTPPAPELFVHDLLFTRHGLGLLVLGTIVGAVLAALVFSVSVISVPLLLERNFDAVSAGLTSLRAVQLSPRPMALWAALIAALTALGIATLGVGLIVMFPLVGHATWHAYREVVDGGAT
jgi:uncharacterized membrane protein